jgi:hypothetical protein
MPATDAGVRRAAAEGARAQQIQMAAAVSAESAEASLRTILSNEAVPAPAKEATMTTPVRLRQMLLE